MRRLTMVRWTVVIILMIVIYPPAVMALTSEAEDKPLAPVTPLTQDLSSSSLIVFGFNPSGEEDAKFYAAAFAQALADRLYCAPDCITQQYSLAEVSYHLTLNGHKPSEPVSDETAKDMTKLLGAAYAVTGKFHLAKGTASIIVNVIKLDSEIIEHSTKVEGPASNLPSMQAELAAFISKTMGLTLTAEQAKAIRQPNFANSKAVELIGRGMLTEDQDEMKTHRWDALKADPDSLYPVTRLLEYYVNSQMTYRQFQNDTQLSDLLKKLNDQHKGNPHIELLKAQLLIRKYEHQAAQDALTALVKSHPNMGRARASLAGLARSRQDGALAVSEGKVLTAMWPENPVYHAVLAFGHNVAAHAVRQGRFYSDMSDETEKKWKQNTKAALNEASLSIKINPNYPGAWSALRMASLGLSKQEELDKSYKELIRLEPKNMNHYLDYAVGLLPQWGGTAKERAEFVKTVEKEFGKDSYEVTVLKARFAVRDASDSKNWDEAIRLMNEAIEKAKTDQQRSYAMHYKCNNMYWTDKSTQLAAQTLGIAKEGFAEWNSPEWEFQLAFWYLMYYSVTNKMGAADISLLNDATKHFGAYVDDVPGDPYARMQYANCLRTQGKYDEARKEFEKTLELDPQYEVARQTLKAMESEIAQQ